MKESKGYQKLIKSIESDEAKGSSCHDYRAKLQWILNRAQHYSDKTEIPANEILDSWEEKRSYWYMNYYQDCEQPLLDSENVKVFDTVDQMMDAIGDKKFICPACDGITTNPYKCNSGVITKDIKDGKNRPCNWKVYGLFSDMGKSVYVFIKDKMQGERIFMPVSWAKEYPEKLK